MRLVSRLGAHVGFTSGCYVCGLSQPGGLVDNPTLNSRVGVARHPDQPKEVPERPDTPEKLQRACGYEHLRDLAGRG